MNIKSFKFSLFNFSLLCIILTLPNFTLSQKLVEKSKHSFKETTLTFYSYSEGKENAKKAIEFAFIGDFKNRKPVIFFIEGSGHYSSFTIDDSLNIKYIFSNELFSFLDKYNILIVGKFGIPIVSTKSAQEKSFQYYDSLGKLPVEYLVNTNLATSVQVFGSIIDKISKLNKTPKFLVMGHSQGSRIAIELAKHPNVIGTVYMSSDPLGRLGSVLDEEYSLFEKRNDERYDYYLGLVKNGSNSTDSVFREDTYNNWKSFAYPSLISISQTKKPLLITFGDLDKNCPNCYVYDLLPSYFSNIEVIKYKGLDHSYYDIEENSHWDSLYKDIRKWDEQFH